jgi:superfamily II DNA or RNA helicase
LTGASSAANTAPSDGWAAEEQADLDARAARPRARDAGRAARTPGHTVAVSAVQSCLALSPAGRLRFAGSHSEPALEPAFAARLSEAFARGEGQALLHLGLRELTTPVPPDVAYFRELARTFLTAVCARPDLEYPREQISVPPSPAQLQRLVDTAPPLPGAEYLDLAVLTRLWSELEEALQTELRASKGTVQQYLSEHGAVWNLVGRVCFHLAENKRDAEHPFAFLATHASRVSAGAKVQHVPLGQAVRASGAKADRAALLTLLVPIEKAAKQSAFLQELLDSGDLFEPLAWTPREAYRFLKEVPLFEASGVVVRTPDWWRSRQTARPQVAVRVGQRAPATLGLDAILDFSISVTLDGEALTEAELRTLRASTDGLALVRGRWVELDRERLDQVLAHWKTAERQARQEGLTFLDGMRLLAGANVAERAQPLEAATSEWSQVIAGDWLAATLHRLREPDVDATAPSLPIDLRASLRPYQQVGFTWLRLLSSLGLGACLADDMGLGKTIQVLALFLELKRQKNGRTHLLVLPASLIANWQSEIARFSPGLTVLVAHSSALPAAELADLPAERLAGVDLVITTYGTVARLPWLSERAWDTVVLDEAQAIKNPGAKQTRACKAVKSRVRLALTGTPVENSLGDLWSIFDFLNPGLLGSAKVFGGFTKKLAQKGDYAPLRNLVRPYILRRMKSDRRIIADLPDKTETQAYCSLTKIQATLYQDAVDGLKEQLSSVSRKGIERRGMILAYLTRFKQICNHPSHWLGDGAWAPEASGKLSRLREICESIAARQEKVLVFSQFREMTEPLAGFLRQVFGTDGLSLHGDTPVKERQKRVERFQSDEDLPFFVLSLKAGGTGLNLTAAAHVIHFDRWWNPAVENQATDRAYRIGQKKNVLVHKLICRGTIEERIDEMIESKKGLSQQLLEGGGEKLLTELEDAELIRLVSLDIHRACTEM